MSNIEHLIENAISEINNNGSFEKWKKWEQDYGNLNPSVKATPEEIWEMALYVTHNFSVIR